MKYSISNRQTKQMLNKADEIIVRSKDYRVISDLFIDYPDKMIILDVAPDMEEEIMNYILLLIDENREHFCCRIYNMNNIEWYKSNNVKFYYGFPVNSFYDIKGLIDLGVEYISVIAPLTFNINRLSKYDMKFRMVPNVAYSAYIPRKNGIIGQWVRPEDVSFYKKGIYIFDFEDCDSLDKERTLYHIYAEQKHWPGNLNLLISNLNVDIDNRAIIDELGESRANCGMRCCETSSCHLCETAFRFEKTLKAYKKEH